MGFVGGRGGGGRKPKPSKVGSKVRRANKKAAEQGPRDAEMLVPGGGKADAEGVDLETVDWDKVGGWSKVKYDPNRLIFGAQEEGFVELEEIDMNDLDLSSLVPAANAVGRTDAGASKRGRPGEDHPARFALRDSEDDEPASLREKKADEKKRRDDAADAETGEKRRAKQNANAEKGRLSPSLSAKEARVEKRKARWLAKVEAAKAKKAAKKARAEAGGNDPENANAYAFRGSIDGARTTTGKLSTDDKHETTTPRDVFEEKTASGPTAVATGSAKDAGWQMDYNNYPTSGFGAIVDGVDLDVGADVSNWLEFDLHPKLLRALQDMGFTTPTPIQREALNPAIKGRCDVIGAAETGSGKTLAFGLPILHRLLTQMDAEADDDSGSESGSDADANDAKGDEKGVDADVKAGAQEVKTSRQWCLFKRELHVVARAAVTVPRTTASTSDRSFIFSLVPFSRVRRPSRRTWARGASWCATERVCMQASRRTRESSSPCSATTWSIRWRSAPTPKASRCSASSTRT